MNGVGKRREGKERRDSERERGKGRVIDGMRDEEEREESERL